MGADDDADCIEHVWVLQGVTFALDGATMDYACSRCEAIVVMQPWTGAEKLGRGRERPT